MKLSQLRKRVRLQVPNTDLTGVEDTDLTELLNQACDSANLIIKCYKTYTDFDIEADKRIYALSSIAPNFLGTDKRGLFFLNDNDKYDQILPKTEEWIAKEYPNYLNSSSIAIPLYYWTEGDDLGFYPPASTAYTKGARIFHLKKSGEMSGDDDYPFSGNTTQITAFIAADDALVAYVRWKLAPAFGENHDQDLRLREFIGECKKASSQIKRRKDITNSVDYGIIG